MKTVKKTRDSRSKTFYFKALPKKRPRVTKKATYMPKDYVAYKSRIRAEMDDVDIIYGDVQMRIEFSFKTKVRGDIDNLCGGVLDAFNKKAYKDDKQVVGLSSVIVRGCEENSFVVTWWEV